jgi:hypothetical protein
VIKEKLPGRDHYDQPGLIRDILQTDYNAHSADGDVEALCNLLVRLKAKPVDFIKRCYPSKDDHYQQIFKDNKEKNFPHFGPLIGKGVLKNSMAENIAGSGLSVLHLKCIYKRKHKNGLQDTFQQNTESNRPRVTNQQSKLDEICTALADYFDK